MAALPSPATTAIDTFELEGGPLPSIAEVRAAYLLRASPPRHLGQNVDITIGIDLARPGSDRTVNLIVYRPSHDSRAWTGRVAVSLLRRVIEFLFGRGALVDHDPAVTR